MALKCLIALLAMIVITSSETIQSKGSKILPIPYKELNSQTNQYHPIQYTDIGIDSNRIPTYFMEPVPTTEVSIDIKEIFLSLVWKTSKFIIKHISALILGSAIAFGLCKVTPFCAILSEKFHHTEKLQSDMKSLITPEKIMTASKLVQKAIEKYNEIQNTK